VNGLIYKEQSEALTEAISKGYKSGLLKVVKKNTGTILKLNEPGNRSAKLFNISYTDVDKKLIDNFTVEAFTVAAVNQYDCEEKLKAIAKSIIEGSHPYMQKNPESDVKDLWRDEAYNILADYIEVPDMPPPGVLQTNLRTAVTSSYHAAQWQRLQGLKDIYPAYRYMTREDDLVREIHRALHGKVFNANDPIWNVITPPNGFNCRCYLEPLTDDELSEVEPENRIDIADEPLRKSLLKEASIDKNFARNSGKAESIWGKWLQEKLRSKNYDEVTERMKAVVNKMPEPEEVIKQLEYNAEPFRMLEFTK
jgi:SPP1 gp7 family putative phage head morphogenesis protein